MKQPSPLDSKGFSLVEMMAALVIGTILFAALSIVIVKTTQEIQGTSTVLESETDRRTIQYRLGRNLITAIPNVVWVNANVLAALNLGWVQASDQQTSILWRGGYVLNMLGSTTAADLTGNFDLMAVISKDATCNSFGIASSGVGDGSYSLVATDTAVTINTSGSTSCLAVGDAVGVITPLGTQILSVTSLSVGQMTLTALGTVQVDSTNVAIPARYLEPGYPIFRPLVYVYGKDQTDGFFYIAQVYPGATYRAVSTIQTQTTLVRIVDSSGNIPIVPGLFPGQGKYKLHLEWPRTLLQNTATQSGTQTVDVNI